MVYISLSFLFRATNTTIMVTIEAALMAHIATIHGIDEKCGCTKEPYYVSSNGNIITDNRHMIDHRLMSYAAV